MGATPQPTTPPGVPPPPMPLIGPDDDELDDTEETESPAEVVNKGRRNLTLERLIEYARKNNGVINIAQYQKKEGKLSTFGRRVLTKYFKHESTGMYRLVNSKVPAAALVEADVEEPVTKKIHRGQDEMTEDAILALAKKHRNGELDIQKYYAEHNRLFNRNPLETAQIRTRISRIVNDMVERKLLRIVDKSEGIYELFRLPEEKTAAATA